MFENIHLAFQGIWSHKLRSILTMLGIIIGIAAIITIVSTIKGTNDQIKQNLIGAGNNTLSVYLYQDDYNYDLEYGTLPQGVKLISEDTRKELEKIDGAKGVSLYRQRSYVSDVFYQNNAFNGNVLGIDEHYLSVAGYQITAGRGFIDRDFDGAHKVVLLESRLVNALFGTDDPIGKTVEIRQQPFTVVGIVEKSSAFRPVIETLNDYYTYSQQGAGTMFIPDACWPVVYRFDEPQTVLIRAESTDDMTYVGKKAADLLTKSQITNTTQNLSYRSADLLEQAQKLQQMSSASSKQLVWIAGISLIVGGIGVMNIMLVSVTERTNEIGLKKAIGAKRRKIRRQFLTEAAALTSLGGILGVLAGIGMSKLWTVATGTPTSIPVPAILIAVVFSMVIGIVFGLLPASKAAKLNPIDALRRD